MQTFATACLLVVLATTSVSGLPKYYRDALYKPGGLDHLDATGDESKWGKMVRWILTGKSSIPNDKKAQLKHEDPLGPGFSGGPDGPGSYGGPDDYAGPGDFGGPADGVIDTVYKPNGRIKTVGPYGPITLDGSVQPTIGVNPDGFVEQIGTDVVVKPNGRLKPVVEVIERGLPLPAPGPVNPLPLHKGNSVPAGPGLDTVIKPNGRVKTVGAYGPVTFDGSVQPTVGVNPDGFIEQIGTDVVVKPDGRFKPVAELINNGRSIRPLGPVNPDLLRLPNGPDDGFGPGGPIGPGVSGLDTVVKPNGRIKTIGAYGPITLDGSVQPTVGVNPDGSIEQIGTDVVVKPDGRLKPVAAVVNNGGPLPPLGPVNPDLIVQPVGPIDGPIGPGNGLAVAGDPFGVAGPVGSPGVGPGPYGYGGTEKEFYERYEFGVRHRRRDAYPYMF